MRALHTLRLFCMAHDCERCAGRGHLSGPMDRLTPEFAAVPHVGHSIVGQHHNRRRPLSDWPVVLQTVLAALLVTTVAVVPSPACFVGGLAPRSRGNHPQRMLGRRPSKPATQTAADTGKEPRKEQQTPWWKLEDEVDRLMGLRMPFSIERVSPPPVKYLGYQLLDAKVGKGDVITVKGTESPVVVSRVRLKYDLIGGRYRIRSKILEVQTPRRYMVNEQLQQLVPPEGID